MWYYEVTVNVRKRATFVHEDKVFEKILIHGKKEELFSSVFQYKEEDLSDLVNRKSVSQCRTWSSCSKYASVSRFA